VILVPLLGGSAAARRRLGSICAGLTAKTAPAAADVAASPAVSVGATTTVAIISHSGGPHVEAYLTGLASAVAVTHVVLGDIDDNWREPAAKILGAKLRAVYASPQEMLAKERPLLTLVAMGK
jgi:hypothetical protein